MSSAFYDPQREPLRSAQPTSAGTMPPPELLDRPAPDSAGEVVLEHARPEVPVPRYAGPRAEEAFRRGQVEASRVSGDLRGEREASIALARLLASRGTDLDTAAALAARALEIEDDTTLRTELAGWFAGLGAPARAAEMMRGLCDPSRPTEAARVLVKASVLLARASDAESAARALAEAAELDPRQAMASELLGTMAGWAAGEVQPEVSAAAYLEAAARRESSLEKDAAFEDRLRAFEIAPHNEEAASVLSAALTARGRGGAAAEILRAHAIAIGELDPAQAAQAHLRRMLEALAAGDSAAAVSAMLDAGLEGQVDGDVAADVDEALGRAGLHDLLAVRLALRAEQKTGEARAAAFHALADLYSTELDSPAEAIEAWIEVLAGDPSDAAAREALREHAKIRRDVDPFIEAAIRVGEGVDPAGIERKDAPARIAVLQDLVAIADRELNDPALSSWAQQRIAVAGRRNDAGGEASRGRARTQSIMMRRVDPDQDDAMAAAEALDTATTQAERIAALRRLAKVYRGRPHVRAEYLDVLAELAQGLPAEYGFTVALERMTSRTGELDPLERVLRARLARGIDSPAILARVRMWLATIVRRRGDEVRALEELSPLLDEAPENRRAMSAILLTAARVGSPEHRADALVRLAVPMAAAMRSTMLAVASDLYAICGAPELAVQAADLACEVDPSSVRAVATRAALATGAGERTEAAVIERGINAVVPRGSLCERLASTLDALGEAQLALAWTQRWVALLPGDLRAIEHLINRASVMRDPARLAEALAWVLAQPRPLDDLEESIGEALDVLFEIDRGRAMQISRRALDAVGPRLPALCARLLSLADRAGDLSLGISVLERWVAACVPEDELEILTELAQRRLAARDYDGASRELVRAAERGADPTFIIEQVEAVEASVRDRVAGQSSDRLVSLAEARARALVAMGPDRRADASEAWRKVGSLLWDLALDRRSADAAFFTASELAPADGEALYAYDLCEFAGPDEAIALLHTRAAALQDEAERPSRARLLIEAANLANTHQMPAESLSAASTAIEFDATRADAIVFIERSSQVEGGLNALDRAYYRLADAALGCHGRRAAHYRAARQLAKRGASGLALRHAIACFEAAPATGTSYVLLARVAERAGEMIEAVRCLQRVAERASPNARAEWLKRAATLAGSTEEGTRVRFDILLSALNARPDRDIVELVGEAMRELIARTGEADVVIMRFDRAAKAIFPKLEGPDGARAAIAIARVAAASISAVRVAVSALERAMIVDGDVDEYATLIDLVDAIAAERESAERLLTSVKAAAEKPYSSVGSALLRFAGRLAVALGEERTSVALLVQAAKRDSDNDAIVMEAEAAVQELGDMELLTAFNAAIPPRRFIETLLHVAEERERAGQDAAAIAALEKALILRELAGDERERAVVRLRYLLGMSGRMSDIEALLRAELRREDMSPSARLRLARELAGILANRGDQRDALDVMLAAAKEGPIDQAIADELRRAARRTGDREREAFVLRELAKLAKDDETRKALLQELAPLVEDLGDHEAAAAYQKALASLSAVDPSEIEALERDAVERSDHEAVAALLLQRIELTPQGERRALRLRRAAVLEQRLGRLSDACAELQALLVEAPDDEGALRFLADLYERLGTPGRAAPLWRKLSRLLSTTDEKADYGLRAASAFLSGGDAAAAKEIIEEIEPITAREVILEMRVRLARQGGEWTQVVAALEALADSSTEPDERRAELLLDASGAALAAGDDAVAIDYARRAVKLAPSLPAAVLEVRKLEYKARGPGTPRDAQAAVEDLTKIQDAMSPEQIELQAFLLAESLDAIQGGGAGMRELSKRHASSGQSPLISLGMAERLVRSKNYKAAVPLFDNALTGDLLGLRSRGRVAVAGAEAAVNAGDLEAAARLLNVAAAEPDTKPLAIRRQLELTAARGDPSVARVALEQLALQSSGIDRARALAQLARLLSDPAEIVSTYAEALPLASSDRSFHAQLTMDLARAEARLAAANPTRASSSDRPPITLEGPISRGSVAPPSTSSITPPPSSVAPSSLAPSSLAPMSLAPASQWRQASPQTPEEVALFLELVAGSYDAGERLIERYSSESSARAHELLSVRKHQASIRPGDRAALMRLREAATADGNQAYVLAIDHVLHAFDPDAPKPPPLSAEPEVSDLVAPVLFGATPSPLHEVLAMVWDTGLYRRDAAYYALAGVPRVQPDGGSLLGEIYGCVARHLGLLRAPLFHQRVPGPPSVQIALLAPPAVILSGEVSSATPELAFILGYALAGAMPEHALASALPEDTLRTLISALLAAYGPIDRSRRNEPAVVRLGQTLWQGISPRSARRVNEICSNPGRITYDAAVQGAARVRRRAGLFAAGDLAAAIRMTLAELSLSLSTPPSAPDGLALACAAHPEIADLVRLASSAEYAEVRWRSALGQDKDRSRADSVPAPRSGPGALA